MTEERLKKTFTRGTERASWEKPFTYDSDSLAGATNGETMKSYPQYKDAAELYKICMHYAQAYSLTMVARVLEEEPEYFVDK